MNLRLSYAQHRCARTCVCFSCAAEGRSARCLIRWPPFAVPCVSPLFSAPLFHRGKCPRTSAIPPGARRIISRDVSAPATDAADAVLCGRRGPGFPVRCGGARPNTRADCPRRPEACSVRLVVPMDRRLCQLELRARAAPLSPLAHAVRRESAEPDARARLSTQTSARLRPKYQPNNCLWSAQF